MGVGEGGGCVPRRPSPRIRHGGIVRNIASDAPSVEVGSPDGPPTREAAEAVSQDDRPPKCRSSGRGAGWPAPARPVAENREAPSHGKGWIRAAVDDEPSCVVNSDSRLWSFGSNLGIDEPALLVSKHSRDCLAEALVVLQVLNPAHSDYREMHGTRRLDQDPVRLGAPHPETPKPIYHVFEHKYKERTDLRAFPSHGWAQSAHDFTPE